MKTISFTKELTDEQYEAFKTAAKHDKQTEDEFLTTGLNSVIEGALDRHPRRREELLRVWGAGISKQKARSGMTNRPIIIAGTPAKQIYDQILTQDKAMYLHNEGTEENPVLRIEEER